MNKYFFIGFLGLFEINNNLLALTESEMLLFAKKLCVSVDKIKKTVPCWKELKHTKSLIEAYKKKSLKNKNFDIASLYDILPFHPEIEYIKCENTQPFEYSPFPISKFPELQPNRGFFSETFIVKIPNGRVYSDNGIVVVDDNVVLEIMPEMSKDWLKSFALGCLKKDKSFFNVSGRVAVIAGASSWSYFHWFCEALPRLFMLKKYDIQYDWLYVPCNKQFMVEILDLLGFDRSKIIQPFGNFEYIQAGELIVPSYPANKKFSQNNHFNSKLASYVKNWFLDDVRNVFLPLIKNKPVVFSKKVFLSRKDASWRGLGNEDEIYELFKKKGFTRYVLSELSFLEQVALFNNAEWIASAHGAGFVNIVFCKPGTHILEIFQARSDCAYFYIAQQLGLLHHFIKNQEFEDVNGFNNTTVNADFVKEFFDKNIILT